MRKRADLRTRQPRTPLSREVRQATDGSWQVLARQKDAAHARTAANGEPRAAGLGQILVVDDEQEILDAAVLRLQTAGFNTLVAHEGIAGMACAHAHHPDAILLDMRMPGCDGLQVLSELRASADTEHIPVVMLSASLGDRQRALHGGARLFLSKPYDGPMLIETMKQVINEARRAEVT